MVYLLWNLLFFKFFILGSPYSHFSFRDSSLNCHSLDFLLLWITFFRVFSANSPLNFLSLDFRFSLSDYSSKSPFCFSFFVFLLCFFLGGGIIFLVGVVFVCFLFCFVFSATDHPLPFFLFYYYFFFFFFVFLETDFIPSFSLLSLTA